MSRNQKIALAVLVLLVVIQFIPMDKVYEEPNQNDLMASVEVPIEVGEILKKACYDCHSNQSVYPWYTNVQPLGFWINGHIKEGKKHLNFSDWGTYNAKKQAHKLEEVCDEIEEVKMPLKSYTWVHEGTRLTSEQVELICKWAKEVVIN
ncbi:MAG: heme-binding domain-containing protein [Chitinophagales bacterium]